MLLLGLETSCDETGAAVVREGRVLSNSVSSQIQLHAEYGGVVPELATREHLRNLAPVVRAALAEARVAPRELDAVAATQGPGLPNALMIGFKAAQAFAFTLRKPFLGIHHHEAHLYSAWVKGSPLSADFGRFEPGVSLIVSGGHTLLVHVRGELDHRVLGSTLDDAAGECFDKIGKLLGLPYPGGPVIDRLADRGDPSTFAFPRPMLHDPGDDFSFSGLKTSVRYFLRDHPKLAHEPQDLCNLCAGVRAAIVEVLVSKTIQAALRLGVPGVSAAGGVSCNRALRRELAAACQSAGLKLRLADPCLCTDNAAMIAILAERKFLRGASMTAWDAGILPGWALDEMEVSNGPKKTKKSDLST
jgi:N6-L-threonylcarbamoyladenine synthase